MALPIVLVQAGIILEDSFTRATVMMLVLEMVLQLRCPVEMDVAVLAVIVVRTLDVMFFEPQPRRKVFLTLLAQPVKARVPNMLVVSRPEPEFTVTTTTVRHLLSYTL